MNETIDEIQLDKAFKDALTKKDSGRWVVRITATANTVLGEVTAYLEARA